MTGVKIYAMIKMSDFRLNMDKSGLRIYFVNL